MTDTDPATLREERNRIVSTIRQMTAPGDARLLDLCGRILFTHGIAPAFLARGGAIPPAVAEAWVRGDDIATIVTRTQRERLALVASILVRIELRLRHDSRAIRRFIDLPLAALDGATPGETVGGDLAVLRRLRAAIDQLHPNEKWWRIGH